MFRAEESEIFLQGNIKYLRCRLPFFSVQVHICWGGRCSETETPYLLLLPQAPSSVTLFLQATRGRGERVFLSLEEIMKKNFLYPFQESKGTGKS